jgi:Zn-dependent peptidase ImmA (M78 family)
VINRTSDYNSTDHGKRFTLAHELFHLLYDRTRARRIAHISGPWAPPGVEKRANAFAAMFLMPRSLLDRFFPGERIDIGTVLDAANSMRVGTSALVEHLYNTSMIDESMRDHLRSQGTASRGSPLNSTRK